MRKGITRREREVTDQDEIKVILDKCRIVHVGMINGSEPYVVPLNFGYTMENGELTLYLHGASEGLKIDLIRQSPTVFVEMECDVTPFDGNVACQYGTSYQSLMGLGQASIIDEIEEKKRGLSIFMKSQTGKDFVFQDKMVSIVSVIKVRVTEYTAKRRPMPPVAMGAAERK